MHPDVKRQIEVMKEIAQRGIDNKEYYCESLLINLGELEEFIERVEPKGDAWIMGIGDLEGRYASEPDQVFPEIFHGTQEEVVEHLTDLLLGNDLDEECREDIKVVAPYGEAPASRDVAVFYDMLYYWAVKVKKEE